jgi:predicted Zn-dependent protease
MSFRNAYQTYAPDGTPIVAFTLPMVADARNADEIAFVLGHEFGHHIAEHIRKSQQQAAAGALILGALMAAGQAQSAGSPYYNQAQAEQDLENIMALGYAVGERAYSKEYELEADVVGAYIAEAAGYDAVRGARFFARPEATQRQDGSLSFWGTHPADEDRLAVVIETVRAIRAGQGLARQP